LANWQPFWFGTFAMLFVPLGMLFVMKTLEDDRYIVINAYKYKEFESIFCIIMYCVFALSYIQTLPTQ